MGLDCPLYSFLNFVMANSYAPWACSKYPCCSYAMAMFVSWYFAFFCQRPDQRSSSLRSEYISDRPSMASCCSVKLGGRGSNSYWSPASLRTLSVLFPDVLSKAIRSRISADRCHKLCDLPRYFKIAGLIATLGWHLDIDSTKVFRALGWQSFCRTCAPEQMNGTNSAARVSRWRSLRMFQT